MQKYINRLFNKQRARQMQQEPQPERQLHFSDGTEGEMNEVEFLRCNNRSSSVFKNASIEFSHLSMSRNTITRMQKESEQLSNILKDRNMIPLSAKKATRQQAKSYQPFDRSSNVLDPSTPQKQMVDQSKVPNARPSQASTPSKAEEDYWASQMRPAVSEISMLHDHRSTKNPQKPPNGQPIIVASQTQATYSSF